MKRMEWYNNEKLALEKSDLDAYAKEYVMSVLIRATNECGISQKGLRTKEEK